MAAQITNLNEQQIRNTEKISELNKDVLDLFLIIQKLRKDQKHSTKSVQNDLNIENDEETKIKRTNRICKFYNRGYCKKKDSCSFIHPKTKCSIKNCKDKQCQNRHLKDCKNWSNRCCKFGSSCEFKHDIEKIKNQVEDSSIVSQNETIITTKENDLNESDLIIEDIIKQFDISDDSITEELKESDSLLVEELALKYGSSCDKCENLIACDHNIKQHIKSIHENVQIEQFEQNKSLATNKVKTNKRKSENDIIPNRKKTKNDLVSRKEEKFACDECNFKTHSKQSLKKHKETSCEAKF